jgi:hypothetical protein
MTRFVAAALAFTLAFALAAHPSEAKDKKKPKPKGDQQEYMTIKMNDAFVSGVQKPGSDKNKNQNQGKSSNTLSR